MAVYKGGGGKVTGSLSSRVFGAVWQVQDRGIFGTRPSWAAAGVLPCWARRPCPDREWRDAVRLEIRLVTARECFVYTCEVMCIMQ